MSKLTAPEIIKILKDKFGDSDQSSKIHSYYEPIRDFAYHEFEQDLIGLGPVEEVEQYGGEDQGSTWYSIKHFVDHDVYLKVSGWYQSHYGTDFDDDWNTAVKEVRPKEKTITVYE